MLSRNNASYDAWGRATLKKQLVTAKLRTVGYAYDTLGRLKTLTYPSGLAVVYSYNAQGRIAAITANGAPLLDTATYLPFGPVTGWTFGNGRAMSRLYDTAGQLWNHSYATGNRTLLYDDAARITTLSDSGQNLTLGYDALDRLTGTTGTFARGYTLDKNGNRSQHTAGKTGVREQYFQICHENQGAGHG